VQLSESDNVEEMLRPLLLGGIIELFVLPTDALDGRLDWFVDVLSSLVTGGIVSGTLRLHLSKHAASVDSIYAVVGRFQYVKVRNKRRAQRRQLQSGYWSRVRGH
jgi:hypothetical protein